MENKAKKCDDCVVGIFRLKNLKESGLQKLPGYCFPYAIKWYRYCPYCGNEILSFEYYIKLYEKKNHIT